MMGKIARPRIAILGMEEYSAVTVTIELPPEIEANLVAKAQAEGVPLPQYVANLLRKHSEFLSPEERAAAWVESAKDLPRTPVLSDYAMSREGIYSDHD